MDSSEVRKEKEPQRFSGHRTSVCDKKLYNTPFVQPAGTLKYSWHKMNCDETMQLQCYREKGRGMFAKTLFFMTLILQVML